LSSSSTWLLTRNAIDSHILALRDTVRELKRETERLFVLVALDGINGQPLVVKIEVTGFLDAILEQTLFEQISQIKRHPF